MTEQTYSEKRLAAADRFRDQKQALRGQIIVRIHDILPNGRIKINWGDGGQYRETTVDPDELTHMTDSPSHQAAAAAEDNDALPEHLRNLPKALLDLARLQMPLMTQELTLRMQALSYYTELRTAYEKAKKAGTDGWFRIEGFNTNHQLRSHLAAVQLLEQRSIARVTHGTIDEWRITPRGCQVFNLPDPLTRPVPAAVPDEPVAAPATNPTPAATNTEPARIEIKTLIQAIGWPTDSHKPDTELADYLTARWHILDIQVLLDDPVGDTANPHRIKRIVTLQRLADPEPAPQPSARAAADLPDNNNLLDEAAPDVDDIDESYLGESTLRKLRGVPLFTDDDAATEADETPIPVDFPIRQPEPVLNALPVTRHSSLPLGPWGQSILRSGLADTLDMADQRVADIFTDTYRRSLDEHQIIVRSLLRPENT